VQIAGSGCVPGGADGQLHGGIFEWASGDDPDAFAATVGAVVEHLGTSGCAFEQQLEATARALSRARELGFPRDEALLGVIVVTDEEDCSVVDDDAFFSTAEQYNVHCTRNASFLTSVSELLQQIRGSRSDADIVFAAIAGIPVDLPDTLTPAQILAMDEMQYVEIVDSLRRLVPRPVCEFTTPDGRSLGEAAPARRLVELGGMLPGSVLTTICTDDFGPAIGQIAARLGSRVPSVCLVRALPSTTGTSVPCQVSVRLPAGAACTSLPGYALVESEGGRELCEVAQVSSGSGENGWFYDLSNEACPQLTLTTDAVPPIGSELRAECFFPVLRELGEQCARGSQCESGYCEPGDQVCAPLPEIPGGGSTTG
jgi:hypothetical protein